MTYMLSDLPALAIDLLAHYGHRRVFALVGTLGAGKTTLITELCRQLGVAEATSSPTFSIVNQYDSPGGTVYHLDCYRLKSLEEALEVGLEELFAETDALAFFVEWPQVIEPLLPEDSVVLRLGHTANGDARTLTADSVVGGAFG